MTKTAGVSRVAAPIDKEQLLRKYREERDKRIRPDGNRQYIRLNELFPDDAGDPYTPCAQRPPKTDHVTFAFVGGGLAGLITGAKLKDAGVSDVRIVEKGGDFGGAWYWNRYPGVQCDTASMVYLPLLEETGYMPTEKYAHGPEILAHCQRIAKHYHLYESALLHTEVIDARWDEMQARWRILTNRGDAFTAQFIGLGIGQLHVAKLPSVPGIESFKGRAFHTSRWDYEYTGGDSSGAPMNKLANKRVGIIGTGATAVQCIPHLARDASELIVFQRTPSSVGERGNEDIDPTWFSKIATPGWQERWLDNFVAQRSGAWVREDLVNDGWTSLSRQVREKLERVPPEQRTPEAAAAAEEEADFENMEAIRARVDATVGDRGTATKLKAWYAQFCKRPCFHDEYLSAFNATNTRLVDTAGKGVEEVTPTGAVVAGVHYPLDCIIYASGFEVGTEYSHLAGFDLTGRNGISLSQRWAAGMRTLHGINVHGFPNAFFVQPAQGANLLSNITHNSLESAKTIAAVVRNTLDVGATEVECTQEAEDAWVELLSKGGRRLASTDCTPGSFNNEGQALGPGLLLNLGYPQRALAYFKYARAWRNSKSFEGLAFRRGQTLSSPLAVGNG